MFLEKITQWFTPQVLSILLILGVTLCCIAFIIWFSWIVEKNPKFWGYKVDEKEQDKDQKN